MRMNVIYAALVHGKIADRSATTRNRKSSLSRNYPLLVVLNDPSLNMYIGKCIGLGAPPID